MEGEKQQQLPSYTAIGWAYSKLHEKYGDSVAWDDVITEARKQDRLFSED